MRPQRQRQEHGAQSLLLRFYDPTTGAVTARRPRPAAAPQGAEFRRAFALVQQETFLFNDTILDNVRYGQPDASMDRVIAAATAANAHEFVIENARRL